MKSTKPVELIKEGNAQLQRNQLEEAEKIYQTCVKSFPRHPGAKERYAYVALRKSNLDDAYARYSALVGEHPNNVAGWIGLGNVLLQHSLFDEAEEVFQACVESFPNHPGVKERYAHVAFQKMHFDDAYARYSALVGEYSDYVAGWIGLGNVLLQQNLLDEAEEVFQTCVESFPDHLRAKERYAYVALCKLNFTDAYARYSALDGEHPESPVGKMGLGNVLLQQNLLDEAEKVFQTCIASFPNHPRAKERYAYVALCKLNADDANARLEELLAENPEYIPGYIRKIDVLLQKGLFLEAENAIRYLMKKYTFCFTVYSNIIMLHERYIKSGIHLAFPIITELALLAYNDICTHMKDANPCFDADGFRHGILLGARNIYRIEKVQDCSRQKEKTMAIFGDSSVLATLYHPQHFKKRGFDVQFFSVSGATITGLGKDKSSLGLFPRIEQYIAKQKPQYVMLKFGQADLEFAYYYKKVIKQEPVEYPHFLEELIKSYQQRIDQIKNSTHLIIHGADFPSLVEGNKCAKRTLDIITIGAYRKNNKSLFDELVAILPSITHRTQISLTFNSMLKEMCVSCGCCYVDTKDIVMPQDMSIIGVDFQPYFDHHYQASDYQKAKCIDHTLKGIMSFFE